MCARWHRGYAYQFAKYFSFDTPSTKLRLVHLRQVHPWQDAIPPTETKKRSPKSFDSEDLK